MKPKHMANMHTSNALNHTISANSQEHIFVKAHLSWLIFYFFCISASIQFAYINPSVNQKLFFKLLVLGTVVVSVHMHTHILTPPHTPTHPCT
jgi:hypothetical protein